MSKLATVLVPTVLWLSGLPGAAQEPAPADDFFDRVDVVVVYVEGFVSDK